MTHIDWSLDTGAGSWPAADDATVLAALRRRRTGDPDFWLHAAVVTLLVMCGLVIALAGAASHRIVLAAAVPALVVPAIACWRQRRTAGRLHASVVAGNSDALVETARFLDRPGETDARVRALRLAASRTGDTFDAALFELEATDAEAHVPSPVRTTRAQDVAVTAYGLIVGIVVAAAWTIELRG